MKRQVGTILAIILLTITYIILDDIHWHTIVPEHQQQITITDIPDTNNHEQQTIKPPKYLNIEHDIKINPKIDTIDKLQQKWQYLFFHLFIKHQLIPTLQTNKLYSYPIQKLSHTSLIKETFSNLQQIITSTIKYLDADMTLTLNSFSKIFINSSLLSYNHINTHKL